MSSLTDLVDVEITVEIDMSGTAYGGAPTFTDVTADVMTVGEPLQITWGRQDWLSDTTAATCSFKLDNSTGNYTPGLTTGDYYPNVKKRARCRVRADVTVPAGGLSFVDNGDETFTMSGPAGYVYDRGDETFLMRAGGFVDNGDETFTYTGSDVVRTVYLFDGLIDSWETSWRNGVFSVTSVEATDMFGRYGSDLPLRTMLHEEILKTLGPGNSGVFYPYDDVGPTLGNVKNDGGVGAFPLTAYAGSGAPDVEFQSATGCADTNVTGVTLGGFFSYIGGHWFGQGSGNAAELFFTTSSTGAAAVLLGDAQTSTEVGIDASGYMTDGTVTGPFVADGQVHQLLVIYGDGWYVDGAKHGDVYFDPTITYQAFNLVGTVWCFTSYGLVTGVPSMDRFAEHLRVARTCAAGESTDAHADRLLGYRTTFGAALDYGRGTVGVHPTGGLSLQQALTDTGDAEGGVIYTDGQGRTVLRSRVHLFSPPPDLILDAASGQVDAETVFRDDIEYLVNRVVVSGSTGATQAYEDGTSISADGLAEQDITLIVNSDSAAMARAVWEVQVGTQEQIGAPQLDCDLFTITDANLVLAVLQSRPVDVVRVENLPDTAPSVTDFMVQGGQITIGVDEFSASLVTTVVPAGDPY